MNLSVELTKDDQRFLARMSRLCPKKVKRAHGLAVKNALSGFSSIMKRGGRPDRGVPKFKKHARVSREIGGRRKMFDGPKLQAASDKNLHVMFIKGGVQHIGFPERLAKFMGGVLEQKSYTFSQDQRRFLHAHGATDVPQMYERPERHVMEPYSAYLRNGVFSRGMVKILEKDLAGTLRQGRFAK